VAGWARDEVRGRGDIVFVVGFVLQRRTIEHRVVQQASSMLMRILVEVKKSDMVAQW